MKVGAFRLKGAQLQHSEMRQRRMAKIHHLLAGSPKRLSTLVDEHLRLMDEEGLPLVWGKAGIILAVVELHERGEMRAAAEL